MKKNEAINNKIKSYREKLYNLNYSEDNIAELYSIINEIIKILRNIEPEIGKNRCLHFVLMTKEREFDRFKREDKKYWEKAFKNSRDNLIDDLNMKHCDF